MPIQYITVDEHDFSGGIDARSSENQIDKGYLKDLLNGDVIEKRIRKRKGYQGFSGNVPVRVSTVTSDPSAEYQLCFAIDNSDSLTSSVDLLNVRSSPIVVYGRLSGTNNVGSGSFNPSDLGKYYSEFENTARKKLVATPSAPPYETIIVPGSEHQLRTDNIFVGITESTDQVNNSNSFMLANNINVNESTFEIDTTYQNSTGVDKQSFIYYSSQNNVSGFSYISTGTGSSVSIPAGTHNLNNFNIVAQCYVDNGSTRDQVVPDSFTVSASGQVDITFSSSIDYIVILSSAPDANTVTKSIPNNTTSALTITNPAGAFLFSGLYVQNGSALELVHPDSIIYDQDAATTTINITNGSGSIQTYTVFYEYGLIRSNQLCVIDADVTNTIRDEDPQITIWGLDHTEIYGNNAQNRPGWVTHIDSYRRQAENRIISGLGGNIFAARGIDEVSASYLIPSLLPSLTYIVSGNQILAPLFWDTGEVPQRTRGYITSDNSGSNFVTVSAIEYDNGLELTKLSIQLPNKLILDSSGNPTSLSSVISTTSGLEDQITLMDMSYARHNGTFEIKQVQDGVDQIYIWVDIPTNNSDYDDLGIAGQAGVFTDQLVFSSNVGYLPGDKLLSDVFGDTDIITIVSISTNTAVVSGVNELLAVGNGLRMPAERTSNVIPMRSITNLVRGDMLSYNEINRLIRTRYINPLPDTTINIDGDGTTATVTLGSGDTNDMQNGMYISIVQAGDYDGTYEIQQVTSLSQFTISSTLTDVAIPGILVGNTVEIDESLTFKDAIGNTEVFQVDSRFIPIEAPDDSWNLTPSTYINHFQAGPYSDQQFIRSTIIQDNMYFTNGSDEVMKFDGQSIYRAGLFPWQPGCFLQKDTNYIPPSAVTPATINLNLRSLTYTAISAGLGQVTFTSAADVNAVPIGSPVRFTGSTEQYKIVSYTDNSSGSTAATAFYLNVDRALDSSVAASGTVYELGVYKYYFRLNAVDSNNNSIASAVTQSQDYSVLMDQDAAVRLRLVGMPAWHIYDYNRLEVEIYRTQMNQAAPFYRLSTTQMKFNNGQGYVDFIDTNSDDTLTDLDAINTALLGTEIGTRWSEPIRAKYMTTIGNRLVLANIKDYPQLDIQLQPDFNLSTFDVDSIKGIRFLFLRDDTDTGTSTDMVNRVAYKFVDESTSTTVTSVTGTANTSFSVNSVAHGITTAGQWVYLFYSTDNTTNSANRPLTYAGWWQVATITDADNFVVNSYEAESGAAMYFPDSLAIATGSMDVPVVIGFDGNLGMAGGNVDGQLIFDTMFRMSLALNTSMRKTDVSITGQESFIPWLTSRGGNDYTPAGRLVIRQPRVDSVTLALKLPSALSFDVFVNDIRRDPSDLISADAKLYPSRLLVSYQNYPEIVDAPNTVLDSESDSAVDVNPADGQEITAVVPFFGEATFTAAQQASILVVFKTNSIYLVDLNQKKLGSNAVQRIETEGLGCTAPFSVAPTKAGIMFANESGIYCLRTSQAIYYFGRFMERNWVGRVDRNYLDIVQGHHYGIGRQYKLSVPIIEAESTGVPVSNSESYVYDHTNELLDIYGSSPKYGSWSRYDNHPVTGWANLVQDEYFATSTGRVMSIRRLGELSDYRDDNAATDFQVVLRANDFGNGGIRKVVDKVIAHYRVGGRNTGTTLETSADLSQGYRATTQFVIAKPLSDTNIDDEPAQDVTTIAHSTDRRRAVYFQVRITNDTVDEDIELAGLDYKVGGLQEKGITRAAQTK